VAAFGYAAGFKSYDASSAARLETQLVALKQLTPAASRLLLSYLIFGKPLAIAAAFQLHGATGAAVHGSYLIARNGCDVLQVCTADPALVSRLHAVANVFTGSKLQVVEHSCEQPAPDRCGRDAEMAAPSFRGAFLYM
jgi:hypothetical protein